MRGSGVRTSAARTWRPRALRRPYDDTLVGGGFGSFGRSYPTGSIVTLTAPPAADGHPFTRWLVDGVARRPGVGSLRVIVGEHTTATAIYQWAEPELAPTPIESVPDGSLSPATELIK